MGAERARAVVALQGTLLRAVRDFGAAAAMRSHRERALATAASLDYVLMLARGAPGARIPARDAERAVREGVERAVDDLLASAAAIAEIGTSDATAFARETARTLRGIVRDERLGNDARAFALIALSNA